MAAFLRKLGIGFIYGVGFALGVAGVLALTVIGGAGFITSSTGRSVSFPSQSGHRTAADQFAVSDTSARKNSWGSLSILGTIHNAGDDTPGYVNVYADLFDKNGKFIDQCMKQFNEGLRKDQRANFMIECHSMPKDLVPTYETFKIHARAS